MLSNVVHLMKCQSKYYSPKVRACLRGASQSNATVVAADVFERSGSCTAFHTASAYILLH